MKGKRPEASGCPEEPSFLLPLEQTPLHFQIPKGELHPATGKLSQTGENGGCALGEHPFAEASALEKFTTFHLEIVTHPVVCECGHK